MDRRSFLKTLAGFGLGLTGAQLALPGTVKCKMLAPVTDLVARSYLDDSIKRKISALKSAHPSLVIGDTHCHSTFSDGTRSVESILQRSAELGLDFLVITEHLMPNEYPLENSLASIRERRRCVDEWKSKTTAPIQVYPAFEVSTLQGHLILVFDEDYLQPRTFKDLYKQFSRFNVIMSSMDQTAALGEPFGGISIVPHPERKRNYPFGASVEFIRKHLVGRVDAIEDISIGHGYEEDYSGELGLASIGSSDDHFNMIVGAAVTGYDSSRHKNFLSAVKARETQAIKIEDSLSEIITAARLVL